MFKEGGEGAKQRSLSSRMQECGQVTFLQRSNDLGSHLRDVLHFNGVLCLLLLVKRTIISLTQNVAGKKGDRRRRRRRRKGAKAREDGKKKRKEEKK